MKILVTVGGEDPEATTLATFFELNEEHLSDSETKDLMFMLAGGNPYYGGGGAAAQFKVEIAPESWIFRRTPIEGDAVPTKECKDFIGVDLATMGYDAETCTWAKEARLYQTHLVSDGAQYSLLTRIK